MRLLARMAKRERESKLDQVLADHNRNEAAEAAITSPDFSTADKALIASAIAATAGLSTRTLERGAALAAGMRARHGTDRDALAVLLPHLRFAEWARDQSGPPIASWAHAISVLRAACHELNGPPPVTDEQADKLLRAALKREPL